MNAYIATKDGEPRYLVIGTEIYDLIAVGQQDAPANAPRVNKCRNCGEDGRTSRVCPAKGKPTKRKKTARKERLCLNCGKPGHLAKTCPDGFPTAALDAAAEEQTMTDDELREEVLRRKDEGQSSFQVARDLHLKLKTVNKFWLEESPALDLALPEDEEAEALA